MRGEEEKRRKSMTPNRGSFDKQPKISTNGTRRVLERTVTVKPVDKHSYWLRNVTGVNTVNTTRYTTKDTRRTIPKSAYKKTTQNIGLRFSGV